MTTNLCNHVRTPIDSGTVDFDLRDKQQRAVGFAWSITDVKCVPITDPTITYGYTNGPDFIQVWSSPTRNGRNYGPAFNTKRVASVEEARKVVAKRIANARKRDTKKFATEGTTTMTDKQPTAKVIQVSDDGNGEVDVTAINLDGEPEHDSVHTSRAKAEARAKVLAKLCGCDWESNYQTRAH